MKSKIKLFLYKSRILELLYCLFWIFPIKKNKIICSNFEGKSFAESPKYIAEQLIKNYKNLDVVWVSNKKIELPSGIRLVKLNTIRYFFELATSKIWIFNSRKKVFLKKRNRQYYIQTWHGCIALKKIEQDALDSLEDVYKLHAQADSKDIDLFVSSNTYFSRQCEKTFCYYGEIIENGTPKNDIFLNNEFKNVAMKKIYKELKIDYQTQILLYAPTFRDSYDLKPYDLNLEKVLKRLEEKTDKKWVAIVKFHPKLNEMDKIKYNTSKIITENIDKLDISELIIASEIVITDYSSVMFDGMICDKKVLLYVKDYENYYENRGTYFKLEELPFYKASSTNEFIENLNRIFEDPNEYISKYVLFKKRIGLNETGKSSELIAKRIIRIIEGKQNG